MTNLIEKAIKLGAQVWEKGSMKRVYINSDSIFAGVFSLEQKKSPYAGTFETIGKAKVWFDVNTCTLHSDTGLIRSLLNTNGFKCAK